MAEWVRASAIPHSEWMVPSSNSGEGKHYFYSQVGDGGLSVTCINDYVIAIITLCSKEWHLYSVIFLNCT